MISISASLGGFLEKYQLATFDMMSKHFHFASGTIVEILSGYRKH
jgi:hypothetical protein